jgi:hypothetical protein
MFAAYVVVTLITVIINAAMALADFARAKFVLANSAAVGVPASWLPPLGALKACGAAGLVAGMAGLEPLGTAAAAGLVAFFAGAIVTHLRARVYYSLPMPAAYLALAVASLALAATR